MYRDAEQQFKSALKQQDHIDTYLYLCKVYIRIDQPLTAVDIYKQGLEKFQGETSLLSGIARIYEVLYIYIYFFQAFSFCKFMDKCIEGHLSDEK